MIVEQLGNFPNTILNLDDKPNLAPHAMKQALQEDVSQLWGKTVEIIDAVNSKADGPITKNSIGIYIGNSSPESVVSILNEGDIYLYVPDLP